MDLQKATKWITRASLWILGLAVASLVFQLAGVVVTEIYQGTKLYVRVVGDLEEAVHGLTLAQAKQRELEDRVVELESRLVETQGTRSETVSATEASEEVILELPPRPWDRPKESRITKRPELAPAAKPEDMPQEAIRQQVYVPQLRK